jgi:putative DNA primase/helicase
MSLAAELVDRARSADIQGVASGVKLRRLGRELVGPCPQCGGRDRFAIDPRRGLWNCRQCRKGGDVIALQQHLDGCDFATAVRILAGEMDSPRPRRAPPTTTNAKSGDSYARQQGHKAAWLWQQRKPIAGSIAETYLRKARGYGGPLPPTLGFLPPRGEHGPSMVGAFALPPEIEPGLLDEPADVTAVHLTKLALDGRGKAGTNKDKFCLASPAGRPIVVAAINDLLGLAITEGIEDALSVAWSLGIGTWAAGAAGFMPALADVVPSFVECVTIFAHADEAGQRGAQELADCLVARCIEVFVEGLDG